MAKKNWKPTPEMIAKAQAAREAAMQAEADKRAAYRKESEARVARLFAESEAKRAAGETEASFDFFGDWDGEVPSAPRITDEELSKPRSIPESYGDATEHLD